MIKHILLKSTWMCITTFSFIHLGQHVILEPEEAYRYDTSEKYVVSGSVNEYGNESTYADIFEDTGDYSRHYTWVFQFFVMMQLWNLICSARIHKDKGCCKALLC